MRHHSQGMTICVCLTSRSARNQSVLINGAIGLQVIVGAITTGVAAASKNVLPSWSIVSGSRDADTLIDRLGLPSLYSVVSLPRWPLISPKREDPVNRNFPTFGRGS